MSGSGADASPAIGGDGNQATPGNVDQPPSPPPIEPAEPMSPSSVTRTLQNLVGQMTTLQTSVGQVISDQANRQADIISNVVTQVQAALRQTNVAVETAATRASAAGETAMLAGRTAEQAQQTAIGAQSTANQAGSFAQQAASHTGLQPPPFENALPAPIMAPVRPPTPPKFKGINKRPRILEWVSLADNYLKAAGLEFHEQGVWHITNFLEDEALGWWRLHKEEVARGRKTPVVVWAQLRDLMIETFQVFNHETDLRDRYEALRQKDSVADYIARFRAIVVELPDETESNRVYRFLKGLKQDIQSRTRTHKPKTLDAAMDIADEADRANNHAAKGHKQSSSSSWSNKPWKQRDRDRGGNGSSSGPAPMQLGAVTLSAAERTRLMNEDKCFLCKKAGHRARDCPTASKRKGGKFPRRKAEN